MEFTNLNLITIIIILLILWAIWFFSYLRYLWQLKFNNKFKLIQSNKYFYVKYIFLLFTLVILLFASLWVKYWEKKVNNEVKWIDIIFVLDVSKSMNVADITDWNYSYTRLDAMKSSIAKFVANHKQDRFGLVIFAWDAVWTIPLTTDHDLFLTFLKWVDYRNLTVQWSDFKKALQLWINRFNNSDDRSKALIFISDWWDPDDYVNKDIIKQLKDWNKWITYSVIWVWTSRGWRIILWKDVWWRYNYQKYKWEYVISKINRSNLNDIASALDASYLEVNKISDLSSIDNDINKLQKKVLTKSVNWKLWDFWRTLSIIWFISFLIFLLIYLFENKFILLTKKND